MLSRSEYINEYRGKNLSEINKKISELLGQKPSGPDFSQSTFSYCNNCIDAALAKAELVAASCCPDLASVIAKQVEELQFPLMPPLPQPDATANNDLMRSATRANPRLGIEAYAQLTYIDRSHSMRPRNPRQEERFPWFNNRLRHIIGNEEDPRALVTPVAMYISAAYLTQIGKILAVKRSKELIDEIKLSTSMGNEDQTRGRFHKIEGQVRAIRQDQAYIEAGMQTMRDVANKANFNSNQTQLLLDIAFLRDNKVFAQTSDAAFTLVFEPLIEMVKAGRWEDAYTHRDFLLKHFGGCFPDWRVREAGVTTSKNMAAFISRFSSGSVVVDDAPPELRSFLEKSVVRKAERKATADARDVLTRYQDFSDYFANTLINGPKGPEAIKFSYIMHTDNWHTNAVIDEYDGSGHRETLIEPLGKILYRILKDPKYNVDIVDVKYALANAVKYYQENAKKPHTIDTAVYLRSLLICAEVPLQKLSDPLIQKLLS